jgi:Kdo2-lipid IVA lauroyltransferase/acyltransferase
MGYAIALQRADFRRMLDRPSRLLVEGDLDRLLGDSIGPRSRSRIVSDFFRHKSCKTLDTAYITKNLQSYMRLVSVSGREHIDGALARGKGAVLCSAHLNSTNCVALLTALGVPVTAISRWSFKSERARRFKFIPRPVSRQYDLARFVRQNIETSGEVRNRPLFVAVRAAALLREDKAVFIAIDAGIRDPNRSVRVAFLNSEATVMPGAVVIAKLGGAPLLMTLLHRAPDWRHQNLEISQPITTEGDAEGALRRCWGLLDAAVRREPAQWDFWGTRELRTELALIPENPSRREGESEGSVQGQE